MIHPHYTTYSPDTAQYVRYYMEQAGSGHGFSGSQMQYGRGIGSLFRSLLRLAKPFFTSGYKLAKPHLARAASGIASDVFSRVVNRAAPDTQNGNGLLSLTHKLRPPGRKSINKQKPATGIKRRRKTATSHTALAPRKRRKKTSETSRKSIF